MTVSPQVDPVLLQAWQALASALGPQAARAFFETHVINGHDALHAIRDYQESLASQAIEHGTQGGSDTARPRAAAAIAETARAEGIPPLPGHAQTVAVTAGDGAAAPVRPTTQVDLARHLKLLDRKWLVTGYVLLLQVPGLAARRIPLNYREIRIGPAVAGQDIDLPLPAGTQYQAILRLSDGHFHIEHQAGSPPTLINGVAVTTAALADGDHIAVGSIGMRIFQLLPHPAEITVVSGQGSGQRFVLDTSQTLLGRFGKRDNDITLQDPTVSREHAQIIYRDNKFWLVPEASVSPTVVNGQTLQQARALVDNDQLVLGEQTLLFRWQGGPARPRTLHSRTATVLFSDLRGWTPLAESMPLQDLIAQMDEYFKAMGEVITTHGGTLMTYQGDAVMAVFGAPSSHKDDPWRAVVSAFQMQETLARLNLQWEAAGRATLHSGIGIHTGVVMVGELGHASRLEYSAMGDATNLAARLEQMTREYNCPIIVSEATHQEVRDAVEAELLGEVTVKGRSLPTTIYKLLALKES